MQLHDSQKTVALDPHRFRILCCGRRWGKTTLAIDQIKGQASISGSRIVYIAPTIQQARDIAWVQLKNDCKDAAEKIWESPNMQIQLVNGSLIQLKGWEAIENLRGQAFDLIVLDEVAMYRNFWIMWQEVIRPTLTDRKGESLFISTPRGFNHFYDLFNLQDKDGDYKSFHFSSYDNPFLPHEEIDKAKQELTEDRFAQEYIADFRKTQGLVYKEFDRTRHTFTELPDNIQVVEVLSGIDWGWTNPAASHKILKDSQRNYWVVEEFYKVQQTTSQIIENVQSWRPNKVYPDPAEPDRNEEARRAGLNVRDVIKDVEARIVCFQEVLKQGRFHISVNCPMAIWEFETYSYPDRKPDHNESEAPIKENDHAMDELGMVIYMQEGQITGRAHTHYSVSAQPISTSPQVHGGNSSRPQVQQKFAHTHIPRL